MNYDLIIVGGGPAAVAAGVYAARKKIKTALVAKEFGGQSIVSGDVQNWIGTKSISGFDLGENLKAHVKAQEGIDILEGELVSAVEKAGAGFNVKLESGKNLETKYVLVASGSRRRRLGIPGEDKFEGKGVFFCSICDAPLMGGKTVAVVGGGNAALEAVVDLLAYASKVYLIVRSDIKGDAVTLEKVKSDPKVEIVKGMIMDSIEGDETVTNIVYNNTATGVKESLPVEAVFVEIGAVPNSDFIKGVVSLNERGEIMVDHKTQGSGTPGIWAAGDVSDVLYKQNNISAGDAVKAVLNIYENLVKSS
jgi:alkyl hydroperoxide reductase subunit F